VYVLDIELAEAETCTIVGPEVSDIDTLKVAEVAPAGTTTLDGMETVAPVELYPVATLIPLEGAAPLNVIVHCDEFGTTTERSVQARPLRFGCGATILTTPLMPPIGTGAANPDAPSAALS
jgi:hypothetical protein